jgi:hypothetical protein
LSYSLVLLLLVVYYSLKVVRLVWLLLVINFVVDFMMCVILMLCMIYPVYSACFGGSPLGEAAKTGSGKKIKLLYSSVPTNIRVLFFYHCLFGLTNIRCHVSAAGGHQGPN